MNTTMTSSSSSSIDEPPTTKRHKLTPAVDPVLYSHLPSEMRCLIVAYAASRCEVTARALMATSKGMRHDTLHAIALGWTLAPIPEPLATLVELGNYDIPVHQPSFNKWHWARLLFFISAEKVVWMDMAPKIRERRRARMGPPLLEASLVLADAASLSASPPLLSWAIFSFLCGANAAVTRALYEDPIAASHIIDLQPALPTITTAQCARDHHDAVAIHIANKDLRRPVVNYTRLIGSLFTCATPALVSTIITALVRADMFGRPAPHFWPHYDGGSLQFELLYTTLRGSSYAKRTSALALMLGDGTTFDRAVRDPRIINYVCDAQDHCCVMALLADGRVDPVAALKYIDPRRFGDDTEGTPTVASWSIRDMLIVACEKRAAATTAATTATSS